MITPLQSEFHFAGFAWPRYVGMLPRDPLPKRLQEFRQHRSLHPYTGPYYCAPTPDAKGTSFYLDSDFAPAVRWQWCDEVDGSTIRHSGWFIDDDQCQTIRGIVGRLPHGRGFIAGWSMGQSMASEWEERIYPDATDAAYAADELARIVAENERDRREESDDEEEE